MTEKTAIRQWIETFFHVVVAMCALIAYASRRDWLIDFTGNIWLVGFFEGMATMSFVYYYAYKYGDAIYETYLGLRELGRLRKDQQDKK